MTHPTAPEPASATRGVAGSRWADHLRGGGTTPWSAFRDGVGAREGPAHLPGSHLPGAQQLELLRRLNMAGPVGGDLADRVLAAGTTGRGRPDLDLTGDGPERPFGARPVDPALLPAEELLRVAVGLLADRLVDLAERDPRSVAPPGRPWRVPLRRRYRVVGDPLRADSVRADLARRRRPLGGRDARVLVLGASLERMLLDAWLQHAIIRGAPDWGAWLRGRLERGGVPPGIDLPAHAALWAGRVGAHRVHVVLDDDAVAPLLRLRRAAVPVAPSAGVAELTRRVAVVLGVLVPPASRAALAGRVLLPHLSSLVVPGAGPAPGLPPWADAWADARAREMRHRLTPADYRVQGDLDMLVDRAGGGPPSAEQALAVAVVALAGPAGSGTWPGAARGEGGR